jgi:hypothetical protein
MFLGQCLTLAFNESVEWSLEFGYGLILLLAEAAGLLAKIPGFLPGDWRTRQALDQAWNGVPGGVRTHDPLLRRQLPL